MSANVVNGNIVSKRDYKEPAEKLDLQRAEGFVSLAGGMNGGTAPSLLPSTQYAFGLNTTSRGGLIHTRPAFTPLAITLGDSKTGHFQGSAPYRLNSADRVVAVISGRVIGIRTDTLEVIDYSALDGVGLLDPTVDRCYFCVADQYMIVQDGVSIPIIIQGATARRANQTADPTMDGNGVILHPETHEVPIGTVMAYGQGRLFVVPKTIQEQDGRRFFVAGDIIQATNPSTLLRFTETGYLSGGGAFALPNEMGFITGMVFIKNASTGSGTGSLVVMAQRGASAFAVNAPRSQWQDIDISQVLFTNVGTFSPSSLLPVNNDIFFRATDGLRTLSFSTAEAMQGSGGLRNNPISREVNGILKYDSRACWPFVTTAIMDNRVFCTSVPVNAAGDQAFTALVVMDVDPVSTISEQTVPPIYDGAWTGHTFLAVLTARYHGLERDGVYAWVKEVDGTNGFYMLNVDGYVSQTSDIIPCRVYTKGYFFGDIVTSKEFQYAELEMSQIKGNVWLRTFYRPSGYPLWGDMGQTMLHANATGLPQRRQAIRLVPTDDQSDPILKYQLKFAKSFEFCVQWVGYMQIEAATFTVDLSQKPPIMGYGQEKNDTALTSVTNGWDLDPFGPWNVFDPFIGQPDFMWITSPFYWRRSLDGTYEFGPDPTWGTIPLSGWNTTLPKFNSNQGTGVKEFIGWKGAWALPGHNVITVDSSVPVDSIYTLQVLSTRPYINLQADDQNNTGMVAMKGVTWGTVTQPIAGIPFYLHTGLVRFGVPDYLTSMGLTVTTLEMGNFVSKMNLTMQGTNTHGVNMSQYPTVVASIPVTVKVAEADYDVSLPDTITPDVPFQITLTAKSKVTGQTMSWHKSDGTIAVKEHV